MHSICKDFPILEYSGILLIEVNRFGEIMFDKENDSNKTKKYCHFAKNQ